MKKQLLLWSALMICSLLFLPFVANATKVYAVNEDFTTAPASNWGFGAVGGHTFGYDAVNKRFTLRWASPTSFTTKAFTTAIAPGSDSKISLEIIAKFYTSGNSSSSGNLYFVDTNGNAIFGIWLGRNSSQYRIARSTSYPGAVTPTATASIADILAADQPIAKISAVLNFTTHTLDYTAQVGTFDNTTRVFTATTPSVSSTAQAFINSSASDLKSLISNFYRVSTTSGVYGYDLMYFGASTEQTVSTANVTVKFKDQNGSYFKSDEVIADQVIDATYNSTLAQKSTVTLGGYTYVLDPLSPISTTVVSGGSTLELLFRKSTTFTAMTWNGTTDTNGNLWSEWYQNFINGTTSVGYQTDAIVTFDGSASNKAVVVNDPVSLGTGNFIVSVPGYSFTGEGALTGTGALSINLTGSDALSLGVTNNLTGATQIAGGEITVSKAGALGLSAVVNGATTFLPSVSLPATTFNSSSQINPTAASSIGGITAGTGVKVAITSAISTVNALSAFLLTPTGILTGELEMNGNAATETRFGLFALNPTYLGSAKVNLKGTSFLYLDVNHTASTINIGTLSGESGTKLGWGRSSALDRNITWSVGSLNENSEFAGTITNVGGYNASGNFWTGNLTHFIKEGSGTLTMSGTSNTHNGNFTVNGGELKVTGAIGNATSLITVGTSGKLSGTGTVGGATTINGTLEGKLNFGSSLTLAGTTKIMVNGFNSGEYDLINVTGAITYGGILDVTVNGGNPTVGTSIKIMNFASQSGDFTQPITAPTGYSYNKETGMLTYDGTTGFEMNNINIVSIYPTITNEKIKITGSVSRVDIVNTIGQVVKTENLSDGRNTISLSSLSAGTYLVKAYITNGLFKTQKVVYQK